MAAERHLTPSELARREGVPLKTVYTWNSRGGGPRYLKIGNHVRYRLVDVLAWEQSRTVDRSRDHAGDVA
jgi:predicted DNA-binding transcriptional regulator AlpA